MKVFLNIKHGVSIFVISEIRGSWLSICVKEAVKWSISTEYCMNNTVEIWCVPHLLLGVHGLPMLNTWPILCFHIQKHGYKCVMKKDENKEPHDWKGKCSLYTSCKVVFRAVIKHPDLNGIHVDACTSQDFVRSFHESNYSHAFNNFY